jgi:RimJ/RimL family protein N-acetyltransferase
MINFGYEIDLTAIEEEDLPQMRAWRNNYLVRKWCRQYSQIGPLNQRKWFEWQAHDPSVEMLAMRVGGMLVGICGLTDVDLINRRAEFSLYIGPEFRRQGYARKGLVTLFHHGFRNMNLHSIWGETFEGNPAHRLFQELLKKDGIRRDFYFRDGRYINCTLYSVRASEFLSAFPDDPQTAGFHPKRPTGAELIYGSPPESGS